MTLGSLCSGYAGLDQAVASVLPTRTAWVADPDPGAAALLAHHWPTTPNLGDITAVDWTTVPPVDVLTAGYPCQPFSSAGRQKGTADERHIWPYIATGIRVLRPRFLVLENVANHLRLGFADVLGDLARLGFDAEWCLVRAAEVGAPHRRERLFVVATAQDPNGATRGERRQPAPGQAAGGRARPDAGRRGGTPAPDTDDLGGQGDRPSGRSTQRHPEGSGRAAADADGDGREVLQRQQPGLGARDDADGCGPVGGGWGSYAPAVERWGRVLGRPAPDPTEPAPRGGRRLSPRFVEWLMGLDDGHVTTVPGLTRNQQLRLLGNGVVPQQGAAALRLLLDRLAVAA